MEIPGANEVGRILDPVQRGQLAQRSIEEHERQAQRLRKVRDHAVLEMRTRQGLSQRACAALLGLTHGRVAQIDGAKGVTGRTVAVLAPERPDPPRRPPSRDITPRPTEEVAPAR